MSAMTSARNGAATSANSTAVAPLSFAAKAAQRLRRLLRVVANPNMALSLLHETGRAGRNLEEQVGQRRRDVATVLNARVQARRRAGLQPLRDRACRRGRIVELRDAAYVPAVAQLQILGVEDGDTNVPLLDGIAYRRVERLLTSQSRRVGRRKRIGGIGVATAPRLRDELVLDAIGDE